MGWALGNGDLFVTRRHFEQFYGGRCFPYCGCSVCACGKVC